MIFFQNLEGVHNTADEMEMYGAVNRKFKQIFNRQEHMKTFKTYDRIEVRDGEKFVRYCRSFVFLMTRNMPQIMIILVKLFCICILVCNEWSFQHRKVILSILVSRF